MNFAKSEQLEFYVAELGLSISYVKIPIDWKKQNFKFHLKEHIYQAYSQIQHNLELLTRKYYMGKK